LERLVDYIVAPFVTLAVCQFVKFLIESIKARRIKWGRLFNGTGGMPSSHTAFSVSVTTMVGLGVGFLTPLFAVALVFSAIVMYDAMGLRRESGKQAAQINQLVDAVFETHDGFQRLKEELGHRPLEVIVGFLAGIASALLFYYVIF